jgi:hypothetical protein
MNWSEVPHDELVGAVEVDGLAVVADDPSPEFSRLAVG